MRRFWILLGLAALVVLGSDQALVGFAGEIRNGSRWQTRLRLFASPPTILPDAERGGALRLPPGDPREARSGPADVRRRPRVAVRIHRGVEAEGQGVRRDLASNPGLVPDADGSPRHPLYVKNDVTPIKFKLL